MPPRRRRSEARDSSRSRSRPQACALWSPTNTVPARVSREATASRVADHVLRREALAELDRLVQRSRDDDAAAWRQGATRAVRRRHLTRRLRGDGLREPAARRDQDRARVGIVLGLRDRSAAIHAGRPVDETTAISLGPAKKSIAQSARHVRFRRSDVRVAGPDDLVDAGDRAPCRRPARRSRARRRSGTAASRRLRAPRHDRRVRPRADGDDLGDAGDARGNRGHQQ